MKESVRERYAAHAKTLDDAPDGTPPTLGLGDPVALAQLQPGETVLDLGSGPGRDVIAAARAVGKTGRSIGVDFTPEMLERARLATSGLDNVSIIDGDLERLPLPCGAIDVVISNCVINLVPDKRRALVEAFRVLRPGGRLAILDTAFESEPGAEVRNDEQAWCACVGGSLVRSDYEALLKDIGFEDVQLRRNDEECCDTCSTDVDSLAVAVTATKPGTPVHDIRPAVPADHVETLLGDVRVEDAAVALSDGRVVGAIALERHGANALLRGPAGEPKHQLVGAALDIARWSGGTDVYVLTEDQAFFAPIFKPVSSKRVREATGAAGPGAAMHLSFEDADLPLLGRPSRKELPTFQDGACC
jgi:SAM-dependent methyltransferase